MFHIWYLYARTYLHAWVYYIFNITKTSICMYIYNNIIVGIPRIGDTWSCFSIKCCVFINRLQVDNSPRRAYESRICNDLHNNALYTKQSQVHNVPITRRESCSDVRHEIETTPPEYSIINGSYFQITKISKLLWITPFCFEVYNI